MKLALRVVRQACIQHARGQVTMPSKVYLPLPGGGDFRAMPAALVHPACCGIKWVNVHPGNRAKGLPTVMGTLVINEVATGFPLGILDGMSITRLRTGAAGGVAAKALANPGSHTVALVGCGAQAFTQLWALTESVRVKQVRVWGYRPGEAAQFCRTARAKLHVPCEPAFTVQRCVEDATIVVTITPARKPVVQRAWIALGTHINAIGADAPGKQELDPQILKDAVVVVDDRDQALHGGELNVPISQGVIEPSIIRATLGEVLDRRTPARTTRDQITVFDSTGIAIHDVALGFAVIQAARGGSVGHSIRLF